ncbi:MAG: DUF2797 domain-containing protein [Bacteroidales bacterium]|nr:DUF2797 domain-containing protein [Bacteroidales bacterium]
MEITGNIKKMRSEYAQPIQYYLPLGEEEIGMNELIGREIYMEATGEINCIKCGRKTSRSFAQGYCYPCFISAPETEECVLRPELCRAHEGIARDMEFARSHCLIEHVVYLSLTSDIKVGVTRNTQVPFRWIDQGALLAVALARTPDRHTAGLIEVALKAHIRDRTNWRNMLKNDVNTTADIISVKHDMAKKLPAEYTSYIVEDDHITSIEYPVYSHPEKVKSLGFDKLPVIRGTLAGIKGQYLIFSDDHVINIRKFGGYRINFRV